jgi:uncharacterized delta-60 repeat protein
MNSLSIRYGRRPALALFLTLSLTFVIWASAISASGAESDLDAAYTPTVTPPASSAVVYAVATQPDGKSVIGGTFTLVNGQARTNIARLNLDGTLDAAFSPTLAPNGGVFDIAIQPDGKIVAVGNFTSVNGTSRLRIVRLNADGTQDAGFNSTAGVDNQILGVALQTDGKILIVGDFLNFGAAPRNYVARLDSDGTLDATFTPAAIVSNTASGTVRAVTPLADGTIYIGGGFSSVGGVSRNNIARLTSTGSNDATFAPGTAANGFVETVLPIAGGQIMVGGSFTTFAGNSRAGVVRLNSAGTVDLTFVPTALFTNLGTNIVHSILPQAGGKFLVAGTITALNSDGAGSGFRRGIIRMNSNGSSDTAFNVNVGTNGTINDVAIQPDGKIIIAGQFLSYNGVNQAPLARLLGTPVTAAGVTISGRVLTVDGRGLKSARVILTDRAGVTLTAATGARGAYRFEDVESGQTYTLSVASRRYEYDTRFLTLTDNLTGLDFVPAGMRSRSPVVRVRRDPGALLKLDDVPAIR